VLSSSELWWSLLLVVQFTSFTYWFRHEVADIMSVSRQHADSSREPPVPAARVVLSPPLLPFLLCVLAQCVGPSMLPTMNLSGDVVLIRRLSASAYQRGDVVVATSVLNPRLMVCKRIIALPGDTITVHKPTPELPFPAASAFPYRPSSSAAVEFTLPAGHCWLQGDNTPNSSDSRLYGAVPMAMLVGRVDYRLWPITQAGSISRTMAYSGQDRWSREEEQAAALAGGCRSQEGCTCWLRATARLSLQQLGTTSSSSRLTSCATAIPKSQSAFSTSHLQKKELRLSINKQLRPSLFVSCSEAAE
jgi:inner membrane protease subunit 1